METISFNIESDIAETIRKEAKENFTSVSQYMRKLMIEKYKPRKSDTEWTPQKKND